MQRKTKLRIVKYIAYIVFVFLPCITVSLYNRHWLPIFSVGYVLGMMLMFVKMHCMIIEEIEC